MSYGDRRTLVAVSPGGKTQKKGLDCQTTILGPPGLRGTMESKNKVGW